MVDRQGARKLDGTDIGNVSVNVNANEFNRATENQFGRAKGIEHVNVKTFDNEHVNVNEGVESKSVTSGRPAGPSVTLLGLPQAA